MAKIKGVTTWDYMDFQVKEARNNLKNGKLSVKEMFSSACILAGVKETSRQYRKFLRKKGAAFEALNSNR